MLRDFTFSNGIVVPSGYTVAAALSGTHYDDVSIHAMIQDSALTQNRRRITRTLMNLTASDSPG